jgi:exopolyphosphatase/guanosine-5'-triphosphate,3'-diphosphate pyrophosphatase
MGRVFAVADIGSNTAHLLVAEITSTGLTRMVNESVWLSLGEVVTRTGRIPREDAAMLMGALTGFKRHVEATRSGPLYLFATEAVRKASNHEDILAEIHRQLGLAVDVISPQREAELGLVGALMDVGMPQEGLFLEAGGGSLQAAVFRGRSILESCSLPIGTGALMASAKLAQPCGHDEVKEARRIAAQALQGLSLKGGGPVVAAGGVARGIWRALHPDRDPMIHRKELKHLAWDARRLTVDAIVKRYSVKPRRAATLLPGSIVYREALDHFLEEEMMVSAYGVREGAILEMSEGRLQPCLT